MNQEAMLAVVLAAREVLRAGGHIDSGEFVIPAEEGSNDEVPAVAALRAALAELDAGGGEVVDLREAGRMNLFARSYTGKMVQITALGPAEPAGAICRFMDANPGESLLGILGNIAVLATTSDKGVPMGWLEGKHPLTGRLPTDFRVQWEVDAFDAGNPVEAAQEAFANMQRPDTTATHFTVFGNDGSVTEVDLANE